MESVHQQRLDFFRSKGRRGAVQRRIYEWVLHHPRCTSLDIRADTGLPNGTVTGALHALWQKGYLDRDDSHRPYRYTVRWETPAGAQEAKAPAPGAASPLTPDAAPVASQEEERAPDEAPVPEAEEAAPPKERPWDSAALTVEGEGDSMDLPPREEKAEEWRDVVPNATALACFAELDARFPKGQAPNRVEALTHVSGEEVVAEMERYTTSAAPTDQWVYRARVIRHPLPERVERLKAERKAREEAQREQQEQEEAQRAEHYAQRAQSEREERRARRRPFLERLAEIYTAQWGARWYPGMVSTSGWRQLNTSVRNSDELVYLWCNESDADPTVRPLSRREQRALLPDLDDETTASRVEWMLAGKVSLQKRAAGWTATVTQTVSRPLTAFCLSPGDVIAVEATRADAVLMALFRCERGGV